MDGVADDYEKLYGMFKKYQKLGFEQMKNDIVSKAIDKNGYKSPYKEAKFRYDQNDPNAYRRMIDDEDNQMNSQQHTEE